MSDENVGVFRRVLVPVEFGSPERNELALDRSFAVGDQEWVALGVSTVSALELAARLARGGDVCVVHATPDFRDYATWMPPTRIGELDSDASRYSRTVLQRVAERHCSGVTLDYVIRPGQPLDVILDAARTHASDAIVLAASARHRVNRAFLGSTVHKVIRQSPCPVFVVPSVA